MRGYLHVCVGKNGQETLVHFGDVNWEAGGQGADGDFILHPLYFHNFEPCECTDDSKIKGNQPPAL